MYSPYDEVNNLQKLMNQDDLVPELPVQLIDPDPNQPRRDWDTEEVQKHVSAMASSILQVGVQQPITVEEMPGGRYRIVTGETRWRATVFAQLPTIPAIVKKRVDAESRIDVQIIENEVRNNLNPVDLAVAVQSRLNAGVPRETLLARYGWSNSKMSKVLSVLKFSSDVQEAARTGLIRDIDTLYALDQLDEGPRAIQLHALQLGTIDGAAVRNEAAARRKRRTKSRASRDPNIKALQTRLSDELGTAVSIQHGKKGSGVITIKYSTLEVLDGILEKCHLQDKSTQGNEGYDG